MHPTHIKHPLTLVILAVVSAAGPVYAQNSATKEEHTFALEEVIVTAQRKAETLQNAAIPVAVTTGKDLVRQGVVSVDSLNNTAPSISVVRTGGANTSYFIRGVGNFTNNGFSDPAVAFNLDDVYVGRPSSTTASFLDVERIEVLKGPQGTLYGRNATGGAVNIIPTKPVLGETFGYVRAGGGNFARKEVSAAVNFAMGEAYALRAAATWQEQDGYFDDGTSSQDDTAVRVQLFGEPNDKFNFRVAVDYSDVKGDGMGSQPYGNYAFHPGTAAAGDNLVNYEFVPAPAEISAPYSGYLTDATADYVAGLLLVPAFTTGGEMLGTGNDNSFWGVTAEINIALDFADLTLIPAYRKSELDNIFIGPGFSSGIVKEDFEQTSLEVRLSGANEKLDWIVGGYYFDETGDGQNTFNQHAINTIISYESVTESWAVFGRTSFNLTDTVRLVTGVRYTEDKKQMDGVSNNFIELCSNTPPPFGAGCFGGPTLPNNTLSIADLFGEIAPLAPVLPTTPFTPVPYGAAGNLLMWAPAPTDRKQTVDDVTYRVALEYDVTEDSLLYASYETGYRSGGFSFSIGHETFDPEYLDAITLGSKNRFMNDRLQINAELFYWQYEDQQVSHFGVDNFGATSYFTENIGESTITGIDVDFLFAATEHTTLRGSVQYLKNQLDDFVYDAPRSATSLPPITSCAVTPEVRGATDVYAVDCAGKDGYNSPRWSINFGLEHRVDLGGYELIANVDARYRDESEISFEYLPRGRIDSFVTADAALALMPSDEAWSVTAYVRNLTDEDVRSATYLLGALSNTVSDFYQSPRTYGLLVNWNF